jgi:hypothetical protein
MFYSRYICLIVIFFMSAPPESAHKDTAAACRAEGPALFSTATVNVRQMRTYPLFYPNQRLHEQRPNPTGLLYIRA